VPADKAGAASGISETAYELGAVLGTAVLGAILSGFYRANVAVPSGLSATDSTAAGETLGGALGVAESLPSADSSSLISSAQAAFDSGVGATATIALVLMLAAALVIQRSMRVRTKDDAAAE
jgi:DHA2 family multidrug resistance protein-like MFS transporter